MDLRAIAHWSPPTSALYRSTHADHWVTPELHMLREVEFNTRVLRWQNTEDGHKGRNVPKPIPLTDAERRAARPESERYNRRTIEQTLAWLGWDKPQAQLTSGR